MATFARTAARRVIGWILVASAITLLAASIFNDDGMRPGVAVPISMMFLLFGMFVLVGSSRAERNDDRQ
jgi:hypothetical protein